MACADFIGGERVSEKSDEKLQGGVPVVPGEDGEIIYRIRLDDPAPEIALFAITYWSRGLRVKGLLALPERSPAPGLVYCRGGIGRIGMVRIDRIVPLAQRGYTVFAPFYRGNEGGEGHEDFGGEDRYDLYAGIRLLRELPETTDAPLTLIGFSRGALMALAAASECEGIGAAIVWGGVSDMLLTYEERVDLRRMLKRVVGHPVKHTHEYVRRSPVCWADRIHSPVLIVHGSADTNVSVEHAYRLARALEEAGKDYTMAVYEGRGHVFLKPYEEETIDFMLEWARGKITGKSNDVPR
jgi:dipeptidyl aminopeptidase/acylaminoacyl peptidase